jgi:hypothetical protein
VLLPVGMELRNNENINTVPFVNCSLDETITAVNKTLKLTWKYY